jgi:DNA-binding response OmpR family regulator
MKRVLVIEDDESLVLGLTTALEGEGYGVHVARTGPEGLRQVVDDRPDLVLLDLMLPGMSGYEICKRLRDQNIRCPVVIPPPAPGERPGVRPRAGRRYVTKPFSLRELGAGAGPSAPRRARRRGTGLTLAGADRRCWWISTRGAPRGRLQPLTRREFGLLAYFIQHPGEVLSRERLLKEAWGYAENQTTRTVDNHVLRLRKHIEPDPDRPRFIRTARGEGYLFDPQPPFAAEGES